MFILLKYVLFLLQYIFFWVSIKIVNFVCIKVMLRKINSHTGLKHIYLM